MIADPVFSKPPLAGETLPPTYDQATGTSQPTTYSAQQIPAATATTTTDQPQVVHQTVIVQESVTNDF